MAKEAVNRAFESTLSEGLLYERRLFIRQFATDASPKGWRRSSRAPPKFTTDERSGFATTAAEESTDAAASPELPSRSRRAARSGSALHVHRTAVGLVFIWFR